MKQSRRSFLKWTGTTLAVLPFAGLLSKSTAFAADLPIVADTDPMAKSLGFCPNADKPTKQCADRKAKERKDQYCHNCQLYTKVKGEGKKEEGKCLLMPKNHVPGMGWCKSWVQKPKA